MNNLTDRILVETVDGFNIYFTALVEDQPIDGFMVEESEVKEIQEKVNNYELVYFLAKVEADKNGITLASDYLGGCFYDDYEDFYVKYKNDYYADMKATVTKEAKQAIKELIED